MKLPNITSQPLSLLLFSAVLTFGSCGGKAEHEDNQFKEEAPVQNEEGVVPEVKITKAEVKPFRSYLWSNGKLKASRSLSIKSRIKGQVAELHLAEGSHVNKGQLLVRFSDSEWQLQKQKALLEVEEAIYKKNDLLVLQGGTWGVDSSVNRQTFENILVESGLKRARLNLEEIEYQSRFYEIRAPFDGMVANLNVQPLQEVEAGTELFTLFDPESMEAEFQLMETELPQIFIGQTASIYPIGQDSLRIAAKISGINPVVNEHGLVTVKAKLKGAQNLRNIQLPDGLAVKVAIEKVVPAQLVVPRSAVVLRSEKTVVFSWDPESGLAKWNYVTVALEGQNEVAISEGLDKDAWVIYEGNLNLDHDAAVKVIEQPLLTKK
jgi:RND family efflux transporter MFP subunit